jgi:hypothetical protein
MPEMPCSRISASASASVASGADGDRVDHHAALELLDLATCSACSSGSRLRWMTPMPPACAMAMASRASVTVSMAEEMIGRLSVIVARERV